MADIIWHMYLLKLFFRDMVSFFVFIFLIIKRNVFGDRSRGARILVYHSISKIDKKKDRIRISVDPELFSKQVNFLISSGYDIVSLDELLQHISGERLRKGNVVALTFDDGFADNFEHSFNLLKSKGLTAAYFLAYNYVDSGNAFPWYSANAPSARPLTWEQVSLMAAGRMTIGSHTLSHPDLAVISNSQNELDKEIKSSKEMIERKIGSPVKYFAYPAGCRGSYNKKTEDTIRKSGYKAACLNIFGENKKGDNVFELKRTRIDWNDDLLKFRMKIAGAYDWIDKRYA